MVVAVFVYFLGWLAQLAVFNLMIVFLFVYLTIKFVSFLENKRMKYRDNYAKNK